MADSNRFDRNDGGNQDFLMGLLAGAAVGVGFGLLFAPKAGAELRNQLSKQAGALANRAKDGYRTVTENAGRWAEEGKQAADEWVDRGKHAYGTAREVVSQPAEEVKAYVRDTGSAKNRLSNRFSGGGHRG